MSTLQHLKAQRTQVLDKFPTKTFGNDGDIVISRISGKGVFLCSKAGGMWYVANKMQELNQIGKASINSLTVNKIKISQMIKTSNSPNKFVVNDDGNLNYKTGKEIVNDLPLPFNNIIYKTAYCSLGQYSDKDSCELNGGTWYYSENDSHDSVSSTPENQLLTVGQSIGSVDAENTLLYDGSTFEIKYNSDYDDNWQTSAQTDLLKLSYGSNYTSLNVDSYGSLTIDSVRNITLDADGGNVYIKDANVSHFDFNCDDTKMTIYDDTDTSDYLQFLVAANGASTISTNDNDGTAGDLTLDIDGDIELNADGGQVRIKDDSASHFIFDCDNTRMEIYDDTDESDYLRIAVSANGVTNISTIDNDGVVGHLTLDADGDITLDAASGNIYVKDNGGNYTPGSDYEIATKKYVDDNAGGGALNDLSDVTYSSGDLTISSLDKIIADDFVVDSGASVTLDSHSGNFIAKKAGTEFSAANSSYAGMVLGYTCLRNLNTGTGKELITIGTSMTVLQTDQGNDVKVTFVAPPSGNVEIVFSALVDAISKIIRFALSDNATFNEINAIHTYDNKCVTVDESDEYVNNIRWYITGLTAGSSYTYFIAAKASSASAYIYHGTNRFNAHSPPITVKAIALPATNYTGE